ncbi:MAG: class II aldolase/adducin family protein [Candidatus Ratteibacteria bacterium]|jgi:L-fuculose-phosphate aldolase
MERPDKKPCFEPITKKSFSEFCGFLYEKELVTGVGGNVSARFDGRFLVTSSGLSLRKTRPESILLVKPDGYIPKNPRPSKEFAMHLEIYTRRPEVNVVCHVHGSYIIAASTMTKTGRNSMPALTPGFAYFAYPLPMLPFLVPGTSELAEAVGQQFSNRKLRALLLQNHGLVTVGTNLTEALNIAEEIHENAMVYVITGGKGSVIPGDSIKKIF